MFNDLVALMSIWIIIGSNSLNSQKGKYQKVVMKGGLITMVNAEKLIGNTNLSDTLRTIHYYTNNTSNRVNVYNDEIGTEQNDPIIEDSIVYKELIAFSQKDYSTYDSNLIVRSYEVIKRGKFDKKYHFVDICYVTKYPNAEFNRDITEEYVFKYTVYYKRFIYANENVLFPNQATNLK